MWHTVGYSTNRARYYRPAQIASPYIKCEPVSEPWPRRHDGRNGATKSLLLDRLVIGKEEHDAGECDIDDKKRLDEMGRQARRQIF